MKREFYFDWRFKILIDKSVFSAKAQAETLTWNYKEIADLECSKKTLTYHILGDWCSIPYCKSFSLMNIDAFKVEYFWKNNHSFELFYLTYLT